MTQLQRKTDRVLASGSTLALSEWLDISWFYPEGFKKDRIIETPEAHIVLGEVLVYKFPKSEGDFRAVWRSACEEILDNRELAPELYLGLRLLRIVDGASLWMGTIPEKKLTPINPPEQADHLAIVMRRIPAKMRMRRLLEKTNIISAPRISKLAERISAFHQSREIQATSSFQNDPNTIFESLRLRYVDELSLFIRDYGSFLDPFSQTAFEEAKGFISTYFERQRDLFLRRGKSGLLVDGHGDLCLENVWLEAVPSEVPMNIGGRKKRSGYSRTDDVLFDVASLAVELEALGCGALERKFEESYFGEYKKARNDALYRFFLTVAAVKKAQERLLSSQRDDVQDATGFLSLAFRYALNLRAPFLVSLGGCDTPEKRDLARSICELTDAIVLDAKQGRLDLSCYDEPRELIFERLRHITAERLREGHSVVLLWPFHGEEERFEISCLAGALNIPHVLIKCELGRAERVARKHNHYEPKWESCLDYVPLEPILPPADLALSVLREIRR